MTTVLVGIIAVFSVIIVFLVMERNKLLSSIRMSEENKRKLEEDFLNLRVNYGRVSAELNAERSISASNLANMQKTLEEKFENISNRVLKNQKADFDKEQKENLANILTPFKNDINNFKILIEHTNEVNKEDTGFLKKHLEDLKSMNTTLSKNADDLVKALKGNSKIQGDWGENQLKNILDMAGFLEGRDYQMQCSFTTETNDILRPDCIISLPDGKKLIVDSKVSISNYIDYVKSDDDTERKHCLELHVSSIKKHISELTKKEYQKLLKDNGLDFVFMFIPNEHAYIDALKYDSTIYDTAYKGNVAITTPSSILPILRTVRNLWNIEKQNQNASKIAERAGLLYDKLSNFVTNMEGIDKGLNNARKAYDEAFKQLATGRGNAINIAEEMKSLGAKTVKSIGVETSTSDSLGLISNNN